MEELHSDISCVRFLAKLYYRTNKLDISILIFICSRICKMRIIDFQLSLYYQEEELSKHQML